MGQMIPIDEMVPVTLQEVYNLAVEESDDLWSAARGLDRKVKIYWHWSAGRYSQGWTGYHLQIDEDGSIYMPPDTSFTDVVDGTWRRNTGSISISLMCGFGADSEQLGENPPTEAQIDSMAKVTAVLCDALGLKPTIKYLMTHGEAADNEDGYYGAYGEEDEYGPKADCERWDLEYLGTEDSPEYDPDNDATRGGTALRNRTKAYLDKGVTTLLDQVV